MPFSPTTFPIDETQLPWGLSLAEVEARLPGRAWWEPYGGWPNLRGACQSVLGLAATACNVRAPAYDKPVLQVSYELAPPPAHRGPQAVPTDTWVEPLTQLLGPPTEAKTYANANHPGNVKYAARWERWPVRVSLSVYGGIRTDEPGGPAAAGLFLDWKDEIAAARPFYEAARAQSAALQAAVGGLDSRQIFTTQQAQGGYMMADFAADNPYPALSDTLLRQSQRALYRDDLLETPSQLQAQLTNHQIALWPVPGRAEWAVSTRWDTILCSTLGPAAELLTLRPAKGGGGLTFSIGDLRLHDAYGTPHLEKLAAALEQQVGLAVSRVEDYDC
jgi:hypothetical protein